MTQPYEIKVKLSPSQKKNLTQAYQNKETIVLRLTRGSLSSNDTLYVPATVVKRLNKNRQLKKGMDFKFSKPNIRKQVGGSLVTSILTLGRTLGPTLAKTVGLSALAGLASEGASQVVKKITGKGSQTGGYILPFSRINQLLQFQNLLTSKQTQDLFKGLQSGSGVPLRLNKTQQGSFLGTLLASIAAPIAIEAVKKLVGSGGPMMGKPPKTSTKDGGSSPQEGIYRPPPFFGNWPGETIGMGTKKQAP